MLSPGHIALSRSRIDLSSQKEKEIRNPFRE